MAAMIEKFVYHVVRRDDGQWQVVKEGFNRPHMVRRSREEAVVMAKRLARTAPEGKVVVHSQTDNSLVEAQYRFDYYSSIGA